MFKSDAAFASPEVYELLEAEGYKYTIRLAANSVLQGSIRWLLARPAGRPPHEDWSLTTLRERLVEIGARIVRHGRLVIFQMAEVMAPRELFRSWPLSLHCDHRYQDDADHPRSGRCIRSLAEVRPKYCVGA